MPTTSTSVSSAPSNQRCISFFVPSNCHSTHTHFWLGNADADGFEQSIVAVVAVCAVRTV